MQARYQYRFYPTDQQKISLAKLFGCARWVWNEALAYCQALGRYMGYNQLAKRLTELKKRWQWLSEVASVALQQVLRHLDRAYRNWFAGKGTPQFKKKGERQTATLTQNAFALRGESVYLAKIGEVHPIWSRPLPSQPSSVTVIKDCAGRYFLSFVVEVPEVDVPALSPSVGVDLGIKAFATLSNGEKYHSPNYTPLYECIAKLQKKLARQVKGSKRRERTRTRIAKIHVKIADIRQDFLHKLSTKVTRENQAVVLEDLNVSGMLQNRKLSKAISRQGWYMFRQLCKAKAEKYKRVLKVINRWEATSQVCSYCGYHWGRLDLKTRTITCDGCGRQAIDRDENASRNIEAVGMGHRPTLKTDTEETRLR